MFLSNDVEISLPRIDKRWVAKLGFEYVVNEPFLIDWRLIKTSLFRTLFLTVKCDDCGVEFQRRLRDLNEDNQIHFCSNCRLCGERNPTYGKPINDNTKAALKLYRENNANPFSLDSTKQKIKDKNPWAKTAIKNTGKKRNQVSKDLMSKSAIKAFKNGNRTVSSGWGKIKTRFYKGLCYQSKNELKFIKYFESLGLFNSLDRADLIIYSDENNKERTYHPDFKIKDTKIVFEIKSSYLWNKKLENNIRKKEAAEKLYDYHLIIDNNFSNIKKIISYEKV